MLNARGYKTAIEHASHYFDTKRSIGKTVEDVRKNKAVFQLGVLDMQIEQEKLLSSGDVVFLDKAVPEALVYYRFLHLPEDERLLKNLSAVSYKKIFILDFLPLINDYARTEDAVAQKKIHALLTIVYESLPFLVVHVPVLKPGERVEFILKNM